MNTNSLGSIRKWYMDYADSYRDKDGSLHHVLQLKLDHSQRVAQDCRDIATDLGWTDGDCATAEAIGLLHDVSRFQQFAEYHTFLDYKSFDHGERAYEIVLESAILASLDTLEQSWILNSIRYHNRRAIEDGLDPDSMRFVNLVRDADKLDILVIVYETINKNMHKKYPEILSHIDLDGPATPALIEEISKHGCGSYENVHSMTDMNLIRMTWVYSINYMPALLRLSERGLLEQMDKTMKGSPEIEELMMKARRFVEDKIRT
jgi:hypothetical protein